MLYTSRGFPFTPKQLCVLANKFFDQLKDWLTKWKLEYSPNSIWNVDECCLGDVPKSQKVVGVTGE